jgi:ABC-type glutathione transport system ATPase component
LGRRVSLFEKEVGPAHVARRVFALLEEVGLPAGYAARRSRQLSGGEKQRISIARALVGDPKVLVCDEILSSLDVITQMLIVQLLLRLRATRQLSILFISHDIVLTAALAHRIVVFKDGRVREEGDTMSMLFGAKDDYTRSLLKGADLVLEDPVGS